MTEPTTTELTVALYELIKAENNRLEGERDEVTRNGAVLIKELQGQLEQARGLLEKAQSWPLLIESWQKSSRDAAHDTVAAFLAKEKST